MSTVFCNFRSHLALINHRCPDQSVRKRNYIFFLQTRPNKTRLDVLREKDQRANHACSGHVIKSNLTETQLQPIFSPSGREKKKQSIGTAHSRELSADESYSSVYIYIWHCQSASQDCFCLLQQEPDLGRGACMQNFVGVSICLGAMVLFCMQSSNIQTNGRLETPRSYRIERGRTKIKLSSAPLTHVWFPPRTERIKELNKEKSPSSA